MIDISVIVPIYNVEEYLSDCLDSLLRQGDVRLQVILIDDGSTDASGEIAQKYAEEYEGFEYHRIPNGGLGHARNVGVPYAKGKYIIFIDSDDVVEDTTYQRMFDKAENEGSELTICYVDRFNTKKHWRSQLHEKVFKGIESPTHITKNANLIFDTTSWNKLILRSFYLKSGLSFPEDILYEDIPVTLPLHYLANQVSVVQNAGYYWRVRDGVSKSITQNTGEIKNLVDRISILRMLDSFFNDHVTENSLHMAKQEKALSVDLMIFVNKCAQVSRSVAYEYMDTINEYIDSSISEEAFLGLRRLDQLKYKHVRQRDLDSLLQLLEYTQYNDAPVKEDAHRLIASLPEDLFEEQEYDITSELGTYPPIQTLDELSLDESGLTLNLFIYRNRINIPSDTDQNVRAWLYHEPSGKRIPITTKSFNATKATGDLGIITDNYRSITTRYNYDGCGCRIHIDFNKPEIKELPSGDYNIIFEVTNRFYSDTVMLAPNGKNFFESIGKSILSNQSTYLVNRTYPNRFILSIDRKPITLKGFEIIDNRLRIKTTEHTPSVSLKYWDEQIGLKQASTEGDTFDVPFDELTEDTPYALVTDAIRGGTAIRYRPVYLEGKVFERLQNGETSYLISNLGNNKVKLTVTRNPVMVTNVVGKKGMYFLTAETDQFIASGPVRIFIEDLISRNEVLLSRGLVRRTRNKRSSIVFFINLRGNRLTSDLYAGKKPVYISFIDENGVSQKKQVFCAAPCKKNVLIPMLSVTLSRNLFGALQIVSKQRWGTGEGSRKRRKQLVAENYPRYMEEDINQKLILFESMWGKNYSCNPSALYEYIDAHYPEYTCVWSLNDPKTPIPGRGKRVRRGSLEYYHCLATAKYLVNNVNFGDDYIKRDGQIEIQTMHGTPLKTLGLDVTGDFSSESSIEKYVSKNERWNYIIVQGTFMEDMVERCFGVKPRVLRTGYPRTDALMKKTPEEIAAMKRDLNLPLDKKVILYAPTWRKKGGFDLELDIEKMKEALSEDYILVLKFHHYSTPVRGLVVDNQFSYDFTQYHSIEDLYAISDMMITDYSSTMFDYALLNRPMVFYTYDYESYAEELRGMYVDFKNEAPGPLVYTMDELVDAINNIDEEELAYADSYKRFREKYLTYENDSSSELIVKEVFGAK